jgi:uncharacterized protein YndB with AHSA1/START domain
MSDSVSVSIHVDAPPERVYALVADIPRMGEWSPECVRCVWKGGATGAAVGARFKGTNRIGWRRWSTKGEVVTAEPDRALAFDVFSFGLPVARWIYRIEPDGAGSVVTESWEDKRGGVIHVLGRLATGVAERDEHNRNGMQATLERIKQTAEAR